MPRIMSAISDTGVVRCCMSMAWFLFYCTSCLPTQLASSLFYINLVSLFTGIKVIVDFLSANGEVLASSGHPCMLHFKSDQILLVGTLIKGVPLLAGYLSESQTIEVRMTGFVEGIQPSTCLRVTLKQRAESGPGDGIPEIYSASFLLQSELPMLKRILWSWRRTIFIWVAAGIFVIELLLILTCCVESFFCVQGLHMMLSI